MIKAEVVFEHDSIFVNNYHIVFDFESNYPFDVFKDGLRVEYFEDMEQAIKYCLQQPQK